MKNAWILIPLAFLFLLQTASADIYLGYQGSDYYFEIYSGNSYRYASTPYTYYQDDYYYFDYPFRYYSQGTYYYHDSGWYSFDDYWRFAPDYSGYYNYYAPDYYYYDGYWNFAPDWVGTYGYSYYGNYYYPPSYAYYYPSYYNTYAPTLYSYPSYDSTPTLTGQNYQPEQLSMCSDATITTSLVNVTQGEKKRATFFLNNHWAKDLKVENINIYADSFDVDVRNIKYDNRVDAYSRGKIEFDVVAREGANGDLIGATIKINGTFSDGTFCSGSDLEKSFQISLSGPTNVDTADFGTGNYNTAQGSTAFRQARESQQEWVEVEPTATLQSNSTNTPTDTGTTYYGETQIRETNCTGLNLGEENIAVDSGEQKTAYFNLRNYGSEDFQIDSIEAKENNTAFGVEAYRDNTNVYSGQTTTVKVRVFGSEVSEDVSGTAYIIVNGHYNTGLSCTITSDTFHIRVNGKAVDRTDRIVINNPSKVEFEGNSGFVEFEVDNPSNQRITVNVYSNNALVSPQKFTINPETLSERTLAVNGVDGEATIYFDVEENQIFLKKFTMVYETALEPTPVRIEEPIVIVVPDAEPEQEEGLEGFLATGFSVLSDTALPLGIGILILLAIFILIPKK